MLTRANWRQPLLFIIICVSFAGLIFSRAILSIATAAFIIVLITDGSWRARIKIFSKTSILVIISTLFIIPFISVLWSDDKTTWLHMMTTKLPLILLPLAFAQGFHLSQKQWKHLTWFFLLLVLAATFYSTGFYLSNTSLYEAAYKQAKVFYTPMHGDHLRFSLLVSITVLLALFLFHKSKSVLDKRLLAFTIIWFVIYLHLLAARTGLISLYFILFCCIIYYAVRKKNIVVLSGLAAAVCLLPVIAWLTLPTFKARFLYLRYDLTQAFYGHYTSGTTDGGRVLSIKGGWTLMKQSPLGIGLGDIKWEMNNWYANAVPGMVESDKLFPSSEWLIHGLIAGWPGLLLFTFIIGAPFFLKIRYRFWWCLLHAVLAFSILFDTGLSTQFGIFMYTFFILIWWRFSSSAPDEIISGST